MSFKDLKKRPRDNEDEDDLLSDARTGKAARSLESCPVCGDTTRDRRNLIRCSACDHWVHVASCTDLKATEIIDARVTTAFKCRVCALEADPQMDTTDATTAASTSDQMLSRILAEVLSLRRETFELKKLCPQVAALREENAELRSMIRRLSPQATVHGATHRGRTPSKQSTPKMAARSNAGNSNTPLSAGVRFAGRTATPTSGSRPCAARTKTLPPNYRPRRVNQSETRPRQRTLRINKREQPANPTFPKSNVRLFSQRILVVLRDTDTDSKGLFDYLASNDIHVISVVGLKQKFQHYRTFVIECNEMITDQLFDEKLWDSGTLVKEYLGSAPTPERLSSCFPQGG